MTPNQDSTKEIRLLLIEYLAAYSVRKDMCLPILLMIGESEKAMLHLMLYMRDKNPSEHEIIQMVFRLQKI